jgi:flagellar biosynthesis/type III secretory pathway protein FliH
MSQKLAVHLEKQISSAKILNGFANSTGADISDQGTVNSEVDTEQTQIQNLEAQKAVYLQACQTLKGLSDKLSEFYNTIFTEHKEEIAKLSTEIARKILVQKVQNGDYEIESIIKEAIKNAPTHEDMVVHLNPEDLKQCQKAQQEGAGLDLSGIKLIPDPNVGQAECVLENPKGIIKSLIDQHLEKIGQALKEAK